MKRVSPALLAVFACVSASGQIPNLALTTPSTGQSVVTGKSESDNGLSITLDEGKGMMTKSGQLSASETKAFRQLQVGRAYSFPEAFHQPADDSAEFTQVLLMDLEKRSPFRALVDRVEIADDRVSLRLCCADGSKIEYLHAGTQDIDKAKALVASLQPEETYEFPAVVQGKPPVPPPAGSEPLDLYVGDWRGTLDGDPSFFITMRCAWRADGQGLWREIMYDDASGADPVYDIAILTLDAKSGQFLANDPRNPNKLPAASTYNAAAKAFITRLPSFKVGVIRSNTATFTDPDTITWKTLTRSDTGAVLSTTSGTYRRLKKKPVSADLAQVPSLGMPDVLASLARAEAAAVPPPNELLKLAGLPPFRATVLKRMITDDRIDLELRITNHEPVAVAHTGKDGWDKAREIAGRLEEGHTYEFPDVLAEDYAPPAAGAGTVPQPATAAMRALQPFIGIWRDPAHPDKDNLTRFFWKVDGTGLWREAALAGTKPASPAPAAIQEEAGKNIRIMPSLVTYDEQRQCYVERSSVGVEKSVVIRNGVTSVFHTLTPGLPPARDYEGRWDPATQTFFWSDVRDQPQPNTKYSGTRRFVSPDRIEWETQMAAPDGKIIRENSGVYERVTP